MPADIGIFAAAVADWRVANETGQKLKKDGKGSLPTFELTENPDVLATIARSGKMRPEIVVGFAAETENVIKNAKAKLKRKKCDIVIANDVSADSGVMGGSHNSVHVVSAGDVESWPEMSKSDVADRLMLYVADMLEQAAEAAE